MKFLEKIENLQMFPSNGRFRDQTGGRETTPQNGRVGMYGHSVKNPSISLWDQGTIGIKLRTKHVIYQKLTTFLLKRDIYVNRPEVVIFGL